ncbi:Uncharacterised protein [Mycobacteroides abscessus subsp. bolletii]|nr:Uncharacterised protein [Mycobacteroides abscessus subsp. bolletii]SII61747.1 Uncharacterised protein [Mycobacteroides abscessus subsp. bolletii]SKS40132.1 Uncharacterised protein [Mycobacteroides abscessus subsp. bolletii]SKT48129.1 Uncharacterised protein [Mycobacteroides abscessus subsp. bolletii]SLD76218.1 Uncharacterised protein [Mycobacteroides abscessus subsp. bolletii]
MLSGVLAGAVCRCGICLGSCKGGSGSSDVREQRGFGVIRHFQIVEIEAFVKGLVEVATDAVGILVVELLRVGEQVQGVTKNLYSEGEFLAGVSQSSFKTQPSGMQAGQSGADLGL